MAHPENDTWGISRQQQGNGSPIVSCADEADAFRFAARLQLDATGSARNSSSTGVGGQHVHLLLHGKEETANLVAG